MYMYNYFTKYYSHFIPKIKNISFDDFWNKDNHIREKIDDSLYGAVSIEIVSENVCQLKCIHCYLWWWQNTDRQKRIFLSQKQIRNVIDQASEKIWDKQLFSQIVFLWWEPTLHPDILDIIDYAESKNLIPILVTNWLKFSDQSFVKNILRTKTSVIMHLPFQPITAQSVDYQNKIWWSSVYVNLLIKAWENLLKFRKKNNIIFGNFVLSKLSVWYAYESYLYCRKNNIEPFFEKMRISDDEKYNKAFLLSKKSILEITKKIFNFDYTHWYINTMDYSKDIMLLSYFITPIIWKKCTMFKTGIHIKFKGGDFGSCTSCCGQTIIHWDIKKNNLVEIMQNKSKIKVFNNPNKYLSSPCKYCIILKVGLCNGWCRWDANIFYGYPSAPYPQCVFIKNKIKKAIKKEIN